MYLQGCKGVQGWEGSFEDGSQKLRTQRLKREKKGSELAESRSVGAWPALGRSASAEVVA